MIYISKDWMGQVSITGHSADKSRRLIEMAAANYAFLVQRGERISSMVLAERITKHHTGKKNAAFRATINALSIYKWIESPPFTCQVCGWHITSAPALKVGEYALCDKCAQENLRVVGSMIPDFPQTVEALAARDGVQRRELE